MISIMPNIEDRLFNGSHRCLFQHPTITQQFPHQINFKAIFFKHSQIILVVFLEGVRRLQLAVLLELVNRL